MKKLFPDLYNKLIIKAPDKAPQLTSSFSETEFLIKSLCKSFSTSIHQLLFTLLPSTVKSFVLLAPYITVQIPLLGASICTSQLPVLGTGFKAPFLSFNQANSLETSLLLLSKA